MKTNTYIDKTGWGEGLWMTEPDYLSWTSEVGLPCLIVRHPTFGGLCGYAGVSVGHPLFRMKHNDCDFPFISGRELSYSNLCDEGAAEGQGICHVPEPGQPSEVWWLGFACNGWREIEPGMQKQWRDLGIESRLADLPERYYPNCDYVAIECEQLAHELASLASGNPS